MTELAIVDNSLTAIRRRKVRAVIDKGSVTGARGIFGELNDAPLGAIGGAGVSYKGRIAGCCTPDKKDLAAIGVRGCPTISDKSGVGRARVVLESDIAAVSIASNAAALGNKSGAVGIRVIVEDDLASLD